MKKVFAFTNLRSILLAAFSLLAGSVCSTDLYVYFGSHGKGEGYGFSLAHFDTETGILSTPEFLLEAVAPAYFLIHPDGKRLYTCNSAPGSDVSAYTIDPSSAKLTLLNTKPSFGGDPSYVCLDATGNFLMVANYDGKSIAVYALQPDGSIGERTAFFEHSGTSINLERQTQARPHCILVDPTNKFVLVPDLGVDKLFVYRFDAQTGKLEPNDVQYAKVAPGSGPRHVIFDEKGEFAYLINEMGSTIIRYSWDASEGVLSELETISTLPKDFYGISTCAEILLHPSGKFIYATNRGDNSVAVFSVDEESGSLSLIQHISTQGKTPRNCEIDPTGKWLLVTNQDSNNAVVFRIDPKNGLLKQNGSPVPVRSPFCERFLVVK
ncbi:lactonase family protein [Sunxiuqinia sp. A32]|uniref:lactonase family protein n=1 Tax=Sunxiuqinia sp. A32 TaxID=3461496 RepID=UPI004045F520